MNHSDDGNRRKGEEAVRGLCSVEPAITDVEVIELLLDAAEKLRGESELRAQLWTRAIKADPKNEFLQMRYFENSMEKEDWRSAQKVC